MKSPTMAQKVHKVRQRKNTMTNLLFPHEQLLHERFLQTDLGQLYVSIPFEQLAKHIPAPKHSFSGKGCKPWLDLKAALHYLF